VRLVNASALALLGIAAPEGHALADWRSGSAAFAEGADAVRAARTLQLLAELEALPLGESRLLADADGRRYRAQRSHFFDRGFARHFLLLEELTEELDSSERATYEKLVRVLAHEVNNTVAATGSVLIRCCSTGRSWPRRRRGLRHRDRGGEAAQCLAGRVHRTLHARGEDAGAGAAADVLARTARRPAAAVP
jgi:hypothetical protein